jgi:type III pantothenate kinase
MTVLLLCLTNANLSISVSVDRKILFVYKTYSDKLKSEHEYQETIMQALAFHNVSFSSLEGGILSSVVPSLTRKVKNAASSILNKECLVISRELKSGVAIRMDNPSEVGSDIICLAKGALTKFQEDALIISLDSVLMFLEVSKNNEFLGGALFPGMKASLDKIISSSAQLSDLELEDPHVLIGKNTKDSISSGLINGYSFLITKYIQEIEKEKNKKYKIIITGEDFSLIKDKINFEYTYLKDLVLEGLYDIYVKNVK